MTQTLSLLMNNCDDERGEGAESPDPIFLYVSFASYFISGEILKTGKKKKLKDEFKLTKPTARNLRDEKLEKKRLRRLKKLEAKLKKKQTEIKAEFKLSTNRDDVFIPPKVEVDDRKVNDNDEISISPHIEQEVNAEGNESKESNDDKNVSETSAPRVVESVVGTELTEQELYAEKMFKKYISEDRMLALIDTPEEIEAKKKITEERQKLKEEKAEERRKSKELKAAEKQRLKDEKTEMKRKIKEKKIDKKKEIAMKEQSKKKDSNKN